MPNEIEEIIEKAIGIAERDSILEEFIINGILSHCEEEHHRLRFLLSLTINTLIEGKICPECYSQALYGAIGDIFEISESEEGNGCHTISPKFDSSADDTDDITLQ